jgi:hypothetical protein
VAVPRASAALQYFSADAKIMQVFPLAKSVCLQFGAASAISKVGSGRGEARRQFGPSQGKCVRPRAFKQVCEADRLAEYHVEVIQMQ